MRGPSLPIVMLIVLVAGCSTAPSAQEGPDEPGGGGSERPAPERTGREATSSYTCQASQAAAVGTGEAFVTGVLATFCPEVKMRALAGEPFRSGRLGMQWSQPVPPLLEAYVEFAGEDGAIASGSSRSSPVVVEFKVGPSEAIDGVIRYGGRGLAAGIEVTILLELFASETPPDPHRPTAG